MCALYVTRIFSWTIKLCAHTTSNAMLTYQMQESEVILTGAGLVSSLGLDINDACAAFRAGISRASKTDMLLLNEETNEFEQLVAHQVPLIGSGFVDYSRILGFATKAFEETLRSYRGELIFDERMGVYLCLQELGEPTSVKVYNKNDNSNNHFKAHNFGKQLLNKLSDLFSYSIPDSNQYLSLSGHAGIAILLEKAISDLNSGKIDRCIVGGVESYLNSQSIEWLNKTRLLKTSNMPVGMQPGEAGAFIILERKEKANARSWCNFDFEMEVGVDFEENHTLSQRTSFGRGLQNAISKALTKKGDTKKIGGDCWVISDLNGECHRAHEWGAALVKLLAVSPIFKDVTVWYPAMSFGDTGASSGIILICCALIAIQRGYSPSNSVFIVLSSYTGERGSIYISKK